MKKDNGKENDQVIDIKQMSAEIAKRNASATGPTQIQIEMKDLWNVTIIDTPGLIFNPDQSKVNLAEEIEGKGTPDPIHRLRTLTSPRSYWTRQVTQ